MQRYLVEMPLEHGSGAECTAREWRVRSATGDLRRRGVRVRLDRVVRRPEDELCLFLFEAESARDAALAAELAEVGSFRVVAADASPLAL